MDVSVAATILSVAVQLVNARILNQTLVNTTAIKYGAVEKCNAPEYIDGTRLTFLYCNSDLGNDRSIEIGFGNESSIVDYWTDGLPLKVITHGWLASDDNFAGVFSIKTAYVDVGGFNVISVDWSDIAMDVLYPVPAILTEPVGSAIAELLDRLMAVTGVAASDVHLIGHSLGAHVMGSCARHVTSGTIGRITGLDPAKPGFAVLPIRLKRLSRDDAEFVDVIHTSAGTLGLLAPIGHADFYPNGGIAPQPGCAITEIVTCSHSRSHELYTDSVYHRKSLVATQFLSWNDFKIENRVNHSTAFMGHDASFSTRGIFCEKTRDTSPYGIIYESNSLETYKLI